MTEPGRARETAPRYEPSPVRLTYEDYCRMPAGLRYELIEGDLRMTPSPSTFHQKISGRIEEALQRFVRERRLGEVYHSPIDVVLGQYNVVQPDILFIVEERLGIVTEPNIRGAPDLVVEILSPGTADLDRLTKRALYARYGVREMWLVDPVAHAIEVAVNRNGELVTLRVYPTGSTMTSPLLPGFALDVDEVFRR